MRVPTTFALAERLDAANLLLDRGMCAEDLLNAVLEKPSCLAKNETDQPRVPAGHGRQSGEFGSAGSGASSGASAAVAAAARAAPSVLTSAVSAEALAALSSFAFALGGAAAVFGTLFVPTPNSATTSGALPGGDGLTFDYDRDAGVLHLRDATGTIVAGGPRDRSGIFHDADTGIAIGRDIGNALVFDQSALGEAEDETAPRADADADIREPKLCPEPTPDDWNGLRLAREGIRSRSALL